MLTLEQANSLFQYSDGDLIRISLIGKKAKLGEIAGHIGKRGYKYLSIYGKKYYVHRIVWLMHHGNLPKFIDHIDGDRLNNKIENLRSCTATENSCNTKIRKNNTSGIKGVCWFKPQKKWKARLNFNKKEYFFGYFLTKEEAESALIIARSELHKEFARYA